MPTSKGRSAVKEYYQIAPQIVESINARPGANMIWQKIYAEIKQSVSLVSQGKFNEAFEAYKNMTLKLKKGYLS